MADLVHAGAPLAIPNAAPRETEVKAPGGTHRSLRRCGLILALLAGAAAVAFYGHDYWTVGRFLKSTDDAYVQADYTTVAPKNRGPKRPIVKIGFPVHSG